MQAGPWGQCGTGSKRPGGENIQKACKRGAIHTSHNSMNAIVDLLVLMLKYIFSLVPYISQMLVKY